MKTGKSDYVAIGERVDKAIKNHGADGEVYRNHFLQQYWRAVMLKELECVKVDGQYDTGPVRMSRAEFWELTFEDIGRFPASVRATPPGVEPPWNILAEMSVTALYPGALYEFGALGVSVASIEHWENNNLVTPPSSSDVKAQRARHPGGAPERYPWDEFDFRMIEIANGLDGLPKGAGAKAELERTMLEWCEVNWDRQPCQSTVKARISKLYQQLKLADN